MDSMTSEEEVEWLYRYTERIALLCEDNTPIDEQIQIARREADAAIADFRLERLRKAER